MKQTIVSAVKVDGKGVVVTFNGDAVECMEAVGMVLASKEITFKIQKEV